jgi:hypothetical protein
MLLIGDVYPRFEFFSIPDPHQRILTLKLFLSSWKYNQVVHPGSGSQILGSKRRRIRIQSTALLINSERRCCLATQTFKLLDKYRPETKEAKRLRLKERAEAKAAGKEDAPSKRAPVVRAGINTVTTLSKRFDQCC